MTYTEIETTTYIGENLVSCSFDYYIEDDEVIILSARVESEEYGKVFDLYGMEKMFRTSDTETDLKQAAREHEANKKASYALEAAFPLFLQLQDNLSHYQA